MQTYISTNYHFEEKQVGQLDSWTPKGIAKHIDAKHFYSTAMTTSLPPWRPIPSRMAARILGVSLQSLANWRMRDLGPRTEPLKKGYGNRIYYRPDKIAEWLSGGQCVGWQFSAQWLSQMGIPVDAMSEGAVRDRIQAMEDMKLFPEVQRLWRSFRELEAA
ncbi:hypothetical protein NKI46_05065 [Mesorhizobium sp. M0615]|uniref:hypothetical protein n=1 Tax=Mesorhizobium sp. M0615 TaxID=2956971 RepID=UPI003336EDF2